jgi:hypothetical protein
VSLDTVHVQASADDRLRAYSLTWVVLNECSFQRSEKIGLVLVGVVAAYCDRALTGR